MESLRNIILAQAVSLICILAFGLVLSLREKSAPIRNNTKYREMRTDLLALFLFFVSSVGFALLTANMRTLEFLKPVQTAISALPWFVLILATSLSVDFLLYSVHRVLHSEHMWRFHRWHHSPEQLFWFTGFRGSFVHLFMFGFKSFLLLTISNLNPWVLGTLAVQGLLSQMLGHVNFDIRIPILSKIIVMPQYHRIHHAVDRKLHDTNYGFFYSFWDKIFGTQTPPESVTKKFTIGLPKSEKVSLWRMLIG